MSEPKCLSCKWEPDWGPEVGIQWIRRAGYCKHPIIEEVKNALPASCQHTVLAIVKYSDNSGVPTTCNAWEAKCILRRVRRTR